MLHRVTLVIAAACAPIPAVAQVVQCNFEKLILQIEFDERSGRINDLGSPGVPLEARKITESKISFKSTNPFYAYDYLRQWQPNAPVSSLNWVSVDVDRVNGAARMDFLHKPSVREQAKCRKGQKGGWWCADDIVLMSVSAKCFRLARQF